MIESLRISEIKIVERAELEFGPGLNVLSGETGAGKSIIIGAFEMLAGARGSADIPRKGSKTGTVDAVFRSEGLEAFEAELIDRGFLPEAGSGEAGDTELHELVVHRALSSNGRSRARVAGQQVPISTLAELFSERIEIASQHSSQALLRPENHGRYLDAAGKLLPLRGELEQAFAAVRSIDSELAALRERREERVRRRDFLAFQLEEIDAVSPSTEELEALDIEHHRLAHAGQLREDGALLVEALQGDAGGASEASAIDEIATALRLGEELERLDPSLRDAVERLRALQIELRDLVGDFERYADRVEADPARLAVVEERLGQIEKLRRKYGNSIEEILVFRNEVETELADIDVADERADGLVVARAEAVAKLERLAAKLSRGRKKAAKELATAVERSLSDLDMPDARFSIALQTAPVARDMPCSSAGNESPEFMFSANTGEPLALL